MTKIWAVLWSDYRRGLVLGVVGLVVVGLVLVAVVRDSDPPGSQGSAPAPGPSRTTGETEPGALLSRTPWARGQLPANARAWRITYQSSDRRGRPVEASALVVAARKLPKGPRPVLAVAHGSTGVAPPCAPSGIPTPFGTETEALAQMLADGWVVVATDYAGLGTEGPHAYLVGKAAAHDVLDSVRAARKMKGLRLAPRTAVWGYSQGGHAALWAGIEAPDYAPGLDLVGIAAVAPATDLAAQLREVSRTAVGKVVTGFAFGSWSQVYPERKLLGLLPKKNRRVVRQLAGQCAGPGARAVVEQLDGPVVPGDAFDELQPLLEQNTPTGNVRAPLLVARGSADELVPSPVLGGWVNRRCAEGQDVDYREYPGRTHVSVADDDSPLTDDLVAWTRARLQGEPADSTC